ncbi:hypothetical protein [Caudoviricetes sp.]|nr:hypothetical protein [Caudoviricetes sp.]
MFNKSGQPQGWKKSRITGDSAVASQARILHAIIVNSVTVAGTLTIYDNTAESGSSPFVFPFTTAAVPGQVILVDAEFTTGIYAGYDATLAGAFTLLFR